MSNSPIKITDVLKTEYADFLDFCSTSGKLFVNELTGIDYVAFRTSYSRSREYVNTIKSLIENYSPDQEVSPTRNQDTFSSIDEEIDATFSDASNIEDNDSIDDNISSDIEPPVESLTFEGESTIPTEPDNVPMPIPQNQIEEDEQRTLSEIFKVECEWFDSEGIDILYLSVRATNCLKNAGVNKLSTLLSKTPSDLKSIRNMGVKSVSEIIQKTMEYVHQTNSGIHSLKQEVFPAVFSSSLREAALLMLRNEDYHSIELSDEESNKLEILISAKDVIGEELCLEAMAGSPFVVGLQDALLEFFAPYIQFSRARERAYSRVLNLSLSTREKKAIPFIKAYSASTKTDLVELLEECDDNTKINDIPKMLDSFREQQDSDRLILEINRFLGWLDFDISTIISEISQRMLALISSKNPRTLEIFKERVEGKTLEEIGANIGVTRERIRQIELKTHRAFWSIYHKQKYDLIMSVYAMRDGDTLIFYDELKDTIGDFASVVWACIKKAQSLEYYSYSKELDAIVIQAASCDAGAEQLRSAVNKAIGDLPTLIHENEFQGAIDAILDKYQLPEELAEKYITDSYVHDGQFFHRGRLTVVFMCDYVLKERFQSGYKTADAFEAGRFKQYLTEFFGERAGTITDRALDAKIMDIGCLCDRGKYIHPDYMNVDESYMDEITDYIHTTSRNVIPYAEIFEDLRDRLNASPIVNRYYLQGAIKKYGCDYKTTRDAIVKDTSVSFVDEIESFVEERGIAHKSEIMAEFTSLSEASLGQVISRCSNVFNIDAGNYIHASLFDIQPSDYDEIRPILQDLTKDVPVNIRLLSDELMTSCPDFFWRNDFEDRNKLFAALNFMFATEYSFSRPYIARLGAGEVSNRSVILQHIKDYDVIDIDELIMICEEKQIHYVALSYLCQMLAPDFIRVNQTSLMRIELTGIDSDVVSSVVDNVNEMLETRDYIVPSAIDDYIWFPNIEIDWNEFLLESIIVQSKKVNIVYLIGDPLKHPNAVFVSDLYKNETFNSFLVSILKDEVKKGTFISKIEMRDWLREKGLIEGKLPNFLESAKYFYVDETGVHITGDEDDD